MTKKLAQIIITFILLIIAKKVEFLAINLFQYIFIVLLFYLD